MTQYSIVMHTPLGKRYGSMRLQISGMELRGELTILRGSKPFAGTVDRFGNCMISGSFETLTHTVSFYADGMLTDSDISLRMVTEKNFFTLIGVSCMESEALV
ncbi:hypothetical protein [Butyricicoccus sp.]|uniref:hypothetical protein n=1 Tax=Butyricicoccus sp. TaxID=2049021 RepID=UPI003F17AF8E